MTIRQPIDVFVDPHALDMIINAVRNAYVVKKVPIPADLDLEALAFDIWLAIMIYRIRLDMQRGQWNGRQQRGRKLLKAKTTADILALLESDDNGQWWQQALHERVPPMELLRLATPFASEAVGVVRKYVSLLLEERFTIKGSPTSARALLAPGSALEWLVRRRPANISEPDGCDLATIFERHFKLEPRISGSGKMVNEAWHDYTRSPYLNFVIAVLAAHGIEATPGSIRAIFSRQK